MLTLFPRTEETVWLDQRWQYRDLAHLAMKKMTKYLSAPHEVHLIPTLQHGFPHSWLHLTRGDFAGQSWEELHTYTHNFCDTQSAQTGGWSNIYKPTNEMKKYINRYINITVFLCFVMKVCKKEKKKKNKSPIF